jgi:hypothetical protein
MYVSGKYIDKWLRSDRPVLITHFLIKLLNILVTMLNNKLFGKRTRKFNIRKLASGYDRVYTLTVCFHFNIFSSRLYPSGCITRAFSHKTLLLSPPELHAQPILTSCTDHNYVRWLIIKFLVIYLPFNLSSPKIPTDHIPIHDTYGFGPYIFWREKYISHSLYSHLHWLCSGFVTSTLTRNTSLTLFPSYARTDSHLQQESSCQR